MLALINAVHLQAEEVDRLDVCPVANQPKKCLKSTNGSLTVDNINRYSSSEDESPEDNGDFQLEEFPDESQSDDDMIGFDPPTNPLSIPRKRTHPVNPVRPRFPTREKLTLANYSMVGRQLGQPGLEKMLIDPNRKTQNQPPSAVLAEAQALQAYYTIDKMSLSLVGHTSLSTLESAL